ncbi:MAG: aminoacyl-tRNA hydrolase [Patescibacteria group bacterium]|nr:MAG: aminoacyl-tRNA hydrolase [Patescibacteria group bacterium]
MKIIIGLGNPGKKYERTRHNVGHWVVDMLRDQRSEIGDQVKLHKTTILMNESGKEVRQLSVDHKLSTNDLLVVHDDVDLEPGRWKLQFNRSSAGHKGVQSVISELGTQEFWRLRIGIGRPPAGKPTDEFVLEEPSEREGEMIRTAIKEAIPRVLGWSVGSGQ